MQARGGPVETRRGRPAYLGAARKTNNAAELHALYAAVTSEIGKGHTMRVEFHSDSLYAINVAKGKWQPKGGNEAPGTHLRRAWLQLVKERTLYRVRLLHVRAHTGKLGNEIADRLAKRAATLAQPCTDMLEAAKLACSEIRRRTGQSSQHSQPPQSKSQRMSTATKPFGDG